MRINGGFYCMSIQDKMFDRNIYGLVSSLNIYHDRFRGFTVNTDLIPVRLPGGMKVRITDPEKIEVRFSLGHSLVTFDLTKSPSLLLYYISQPRTREFVIVFEF